MPDIDPVIKIFVSRRIDVDSVVVENPLFIPVRCGAIYDTTKNSPYSGDDSGDNISRKRMSFCEFTVQYWAWKNVSADYYGLCHYRRYLSFSEKTFKTGPHGLVSSPLLYEKTMEKFKLLDESRMRDIIGTHDLVCTRGIPVSQIFTPRGRAETVYDLWQAHEGYFFEKGIIPLFFDLIDQLAPEFSGSAREYFAGDTHIGYNCYVMRKKLFDRMCALQFPIMEALETELAGTESMEKFSRTPAYVGEMFFGVFVYHVTTHEKCSRKELQLVIFEETKPVNSRAKQIFYFARTTIDRLVWKSTMFLFPVGTKRREKMKHIYKKITGH